MKRYWFLGTLVLVLATVMVVLGPAGMSVGQNGYTTIGGLSVSPSGAVCIGGTVTLSGSGAPANTLLTVWMHWATFEWPSASLGSTTTDGAGNWSLTTTIPTMQENGSGVPSPLLAGDWVVQA